MALTQRQLFLLIVLTICWGINWPIMKLAVSEVTPLFYRVITMAGGAFVLAAWLRHKGYSLKLTKKQLGKIFILTLPNMIGWHIFSIFGVAELASGRASILGFTMPVWTVLFSVLFLKQKLTLRLLFSVVIVSIAIALLSMNELKNIDGRLTGIIWMQLAASSWALGIILLKKIKLDVPIEVVTVWMLAIGSVIVFTVASYHEPAPTWSEYSAQAWFTIFYGLFINFVIGQLIWFGMAHTLPPSVSAFSVMCIPLVGLAGGFILAKEVPQTADLIAVACIIAAIANTVFAKKRGIPSASS